MSNEIKQPEYFFKRYRIMWLSLVALTYVLLPLATLGFIGLIPWISSTVAVMIFLGSLGLHVTLFVAGRWSAADGITALKTKEEND